MKKLKTPTAVTTAVLTLITIFFWAGFEVYRSLTVKPVPTVAEAVIKPIDPSLDTNTLGKLQQRIFLTNDQIGNIQAVTEPTATPQPTLLPQSTVPPGATPFATSTASAKATP